MVEYKKDMVEIEIDVNDRLTKEDQLENKFWKVEKL